MATSTGPWQVALGTTASLRIRLVDSQADSLKGIRAGERIRNTRPLGPEVLDFVFSFGFGLGSG